MFGWLAKLLVKTPYVGSSCACCAGKNEEMRRLQKAIDRGELPEDELSFSSGTYHIKCSGSGNCSPQKHDEESFSSFSEEKNEVIHEED